jgi:hypothetical protein
MSINIPTVYQTAFNANVVKALQKGSLLSGTVRNDGKIVGNTVIFRKSDKILAQEYNMGSPLLPGNTNYENVEINLKAFYAMDLVYMLSKPAFNFDESIVISENVAKALARSIDQKIIDNGLAKTATAPLGGNSTDPKTGDWLKVSVFDKVLEAFDDACIPEDERFFVCRPVHITQLLASTSGHEDTEVLRSIQERKEGSFRTFKIIQIETREEGGLRANPSLSSSARAYFYAKSCVGEGTNMSSMETRTDYRADLDAVQHTAKTWIGAGILRNEGVIPIDSPNTTTDMPFASEKVKHVIIDNVDEIPVAS